MKKSSIILITIFCHITTLFSQDLSGVWTGKLYQSTGGVRSEYLFEMHLQQTREKVTGTTLIRFIDKPEIKGKLAVEGYFQDDTLYFRETKILAENKETYMSWCIKEGKLFCSKNDTSFTMQGKWKGKTGFSICSPGNIFVSQPLIHNTFTKRRIKRGKNVTIATQKLSISIYDHQREDGDTISLKFNDKWLLRKFGLKNEPYLLEVEIDELRIDNFLILYAHNLGTQPPNTAAISFYDGKRKRLIILNSDLKKSDIIHFTYKE